MFYMKRHKIAVACDKYDKQRSISCRKQKKNENTHIYIQNRIYKTVNELPSRRSML